MTSTLRTSASVLLAACAVTGLAAGTAQASTVTSEGGVLVIRAAPGEANSVHVSPHDDKPGMLAVSDVGKVQTATSACTYDSEYHTWLTCETPTGGIRIETLDGNDSVNVDGDTPANIPVTVDGGPGDDWLNGDLYGARPETLLGGPGNDKLYGGAGDDVLRAGDGDDELEGVGGNDQLYGEGGNDKLRGDDHRSTGTDVIDGGAGYDQTDGDWMGESGSFQPYITVSLDGAANDGRPGENDNVTGLEKIYLNAPATLIGTDGNDEFTTFNTGDGPTKLIGNGGDDKLNAFDHNDEVDGGPGNDTVVGGYGDDIVTGGPGRDQIAGDTTSSVCNYIQCRLPYGNDTIKAQDGEIDSIDCGIGQDTAYVDANDVVAASCETVIKGAANGPTGTQAGANDPAKDTTSAVAVRKTKLGAALRNGLVVTVAAPAKGTVSVVATSKGRIVAKGKAKAKTASKVAVKLRFTKAGKRALKRASSAKLALRVTFKPAKGKATTSSQQITLTR